MAEMIATRRSKVKERPKVVLGDVPEPPDLGMLGMAATGPPQEEEKVALVAEEAQLPWQAAPIEEEAPSAPPPPLAMRSETLVVAAPIGRLYPSIQRYQSGLEAGPEEPREALDMVVESLRQPEAPLEDWLLPEAMAEGDLARYYENRLLDGLEESERQFLGEAAPQVHPLLELVERWERAVAGAGQARERAKAEREACGQRAKDLWKVSERTGTKEARCRDNQVVRRGFSFEEAVLDGPGLERLEQGLRRVAQAAKDDLVAAQYEAAVGRALVEDLLVRTRPGPMPEVRRCIAVLLQVLRRPQAHPSCRGVIQDWVVFLGGAIASGGGPADRLYLLWQLLHAPAGVGEWGAGLVQTPPGPAQMDLSVASLALVLASDRQRPREQLLRAWEPGVSGPEDGGQWTVLDSEGEEEAAAGPGAWALLREADLTALLRQVPLKAVFRLALAIEDRAGPSAEAGYDPGRCCHPGALLALMALSRRMLSLLDRGLDLHPLPRYSNFNKRIGRLIRHTLQFLTDHMELVLSLSTTAPFEHHFPGDSRLRLLAQYEAVFEAGLVSLLRHRRHEAWQCLADLPWRLLSPARKEAALRLLACPGSPPHPERLQDALQATLEAAGRESEAVFLLTAIANLALECRPAIGREARLLANATDLLFQTCYVVPATRMALSKVGRGLLSTVCLQHPSALSTLLEAVRLWHPSLGQMGLFLFRELPFCLLVPSEAEVRLLALWLTESAPASLCSQLARHVLANLNWGFANSEQTALFLPLSLHWRVAELLVAVYRRHALPAAADTKSWLQESMRLVTSLWWNQDAGQEQSFHVWCLSLAIRLRLHPSSRPRVPLQEAPPGSPEWAAALADGLQERCTSPVAMYMAVAAREDARSADQASVRVLAGLVGRHQQYRPTLELLAALLQGSTGPELALLAGHEAFLGVWRQLLHADETFYGLLRGLVVARTFPGAVLSCVGTALCPALVLPEERPRQEALLLSLLRACLALPAWSQDPCALWLLERLLEMDTALDLQVGSAEMYAVTKAHTDKQLHDATKRSGLAQMFRLGATFQTLQTQLLAGGEYPWLRGYLVEAQARVEDDLGLWAAILHKLLAARKKEGRSVAAAVADGCKHLRLAVSFGQASLAVVQAAQALAGCPPDHLGLARAATAFFRRYLGLARLWDPALSAHGSPGHLLFQDDGLLPVLGAARAAIGASRVHWATHVDLLLKQQQQGQDFDPARLVQAQRWRDALETFLLWVDEPRLHLADFPIQGLPPQYRADLVGRLRAGALSLEEVSLPRRLVLEGPRAGAAQWASRHDLDLRFLRLAEAARRKEPPPVADRLLQRFLRQGSQEALPGPGTDLQAAPPPPAPALASSTRTLEYAGGPLAVMYQCAAKARANGNCLQEADRKFLAALARLYEQSAVSHTAQVPCSKGQHCLGPASILIAYQTWTLRKDVQTEVTRNRQDYNQLVDEMVEFAALDQLVKAVVCLQSLVTSLGGQLGRCQGEDDLKRLVECGMALFFHIGRQINPETQGYPPHRHMVSSIMEPLGATFVPLAGSQATRLLQGMLENPLLVEVYGPHFTPSLDEGGCPGMYSQVVGALLDGKCPLETSLVLLAKFNMRQFLERFPRLGSRTAMAASLCEVLGKLRPGDEGDLRLEEVHVENLHLLLATAFGKCLGPVLQRFRGLCQEGRLGPQLWAVLVRCGREDMASHGGELSLTTEEVRAELEATTTWLSGLRFSQEASRREGLFLTHGPHAAPFSAVCGLLLDALLFKLCRSASADIISWEEVIRTGWDLVLKVYIPWLQAFPAPEGMDPAAISLPWRPRDRQYAEGMTRLAVDQLNAFLAIIPNEDPRGYLMHCVLLWVVSGLLAPRQLPSSPFHEVYCPALRQLRWDALRPSCDCIRVILEFFSRSYNSEQSMALLIEVASKVRWSAAAHFQDPVYEGLLFEMLVAMVSKARTVFKIEATEVLADQLTEVEWTALSVADYRKGMEQLAASLEPRVVLCNPSTIEGKVIGLLRHVVGQAGAPGTSLGPSLAGLAEKQAVYVGTVVRLLVVAFSFAQSAAGGKAAGKGRPSVGEEGQLGLFLLRVGGLLTEVEAAVAPLQDQAARHGLALGMLAEALALFRSPAIAGQALEPVLDWVRQSRDSCLVLPLLVAVFRWPPHVPAMARLAQELIEAYLLSEMSDGGKASWGTVTSVGRLGADLEQQFVRESVRQGCMLCLVQQALLAVPVVPEGGLEGWQQRLLDWLEEARPEGPAGEQGALLLVALLLRLLAKAASRSPRPGRSFESALQLLLRLSQSKKASGLLGMVGMGRRSSFSFPFRVTCRAVLVFLQAQLPTSGLLRTGAHHPGGLTSQTMVVAARPPGEPLPSNKTLQQLDWLKGQRQSKEASPATRQAIEAALAFICEPAHSVLDALGLLRAMCLVLWPGHKLLGLLLLDGDQLP